jgi:hypothetical protein
VKPVKVRLEVTLPRDGTSLTVRLERGAVAAPAEAPGLCDAPEASDLPSVETQLHQAQRLLAECELYESAATLRREMAQRLGMGGGDEDECEGRGP